MTDRSRRQNVRVGIALSGGVARGLAQVGVFKTLERAGISVDLIAGTSIGAIVGAVYACWPDALELERRILDFVRSREIQRINLGTIQKLGGIMPLEDKSESDGSTGLFERLQQTVRGLVASHRAISRMSVLKGGR